VLTDVFLHGKAASLGGRAWSEMNKIRLDWSSDASTCCCDVIRSSLLIWVVLNRYHFASGSSWHSAASRLVLSSRCYRSHGCFVAICRNAKGLNTVNTNPL
jgi:hypothetical protein